MPLFTSSFNADYGPAVMLVRMLWKATPVLVVTAILVVVLGELSMRIWYLPDLHYHSDPELGYTYEPSQKAITWLGNWSVPSPIVTINSDGLRGENIDWQQPILLTLGSSEVLGPGVKDDETWSALLEGELLRNEKLLSLVVANGGIGGHGPAQQADYFNRIANSHKLTAAIMRVSIGDRLFGLVHRPTTSGGPGFSRVKRLILAHSWFLPFLKNKIQSQAGPIEVALNMRRFQSTDLQAALPARIEAGMKMWEDYKSSWKQAAETSIEHNVPLMFFVCNPLGDENNSYLTKQLSKLARNYPHVSVVELGPKAFDLETLLLEDRRFAFESQLTLGYDPHANAKQHLLTAEALHDSIEKNGNLLTIKN